MTSVVLRRQLRSGIAPITGALAAAVIVAHVASRGWNWRYEWLRTIFQYGFVTVFLGPLAAAMAASAGASWGRSQLPTAGAARNRRVVVATLGAIELWLATAFLGGLLIVSAIARAAGTPGWPPARDCLAALAALSLIMGWAAAGFGFGWLLRVPAIAAPVAAVGSFAFMVLAYNGLPGHLVDVGGTTSSLIGLQPKLRIVVGQTLFWSAIGVAAALAVSLVPRRQLVLVAMVPLVAAGLGYSLQVQAGGDRFARGPNGGVTCEGRPAICLAPGYERFRPSAERSVAPALRILANDGLALPAVFTQNQANLGYGRGYLDLAAIRGDVQSGGLAVLNALLPTGCVAFDHPAASQAFGQLQDLLVAPLPAFGLAPARSLRGRPASEVRAAVRTLAVCRD